MDARPLRRAQTLTATVAAAGIARAEGGARRRWWRTGYAQLWAPSAMMGLGVGLALTPMNLAAMNATTRAPPRACS